MECPKCGVGNWEDAERCRICGAELTPRRRPSGPVKECAFCRALNEVDAVMALVWGVWLIITAVLLLGAILALILVTISRREFMLT